ncbi:hypothetical protein BP5796_02111 [Coleophoma crateriformis]|uniref:Heterokaryon incompatibility domain-containing protein n=1 Tax=Coleophoma crateriformis TaxID=565419 RepID=A0A3D8SXB3_9HELO|nr:hypothetical protein BP5796_02111 [Coleophoma crateriformis]
MQQSSPLWQVVEDIYGPESMGQGYTRPFSSFYRLAVHFNATIIAVEKTTLAQSMSLSATQTRSFWILWRWWNTYSHACLIPSGGATDEDLHVYLVDGMRYQLSIESNYFQQGLSLFEREFNDSQAMFDSKVLESRREEMAVQSACQHIALGCYAQLGRNIADDCNFSLHPADLLAPKSDGAFENGRMILQDRDLSGLDPRCSTGASIIACPWLGDTPGLPFYLWDVAAREVVEVSSLPPDVAYTAISHTWGRWPKDAPIWVPGVTEWLVPQNEVFDVLNLPSILAKVPTTTPYIWFDLVCIPQNGSPRATQEIARQAEIFRHAKHAIIWLNRIDSWEGLEAALEWMSLVYLGIGSPKDAKTPELATKLFADYPYAPGVSRQSMEVTGWFSSLWTLQEICLRPDMWLCNSDWTLLQVGNGIPVAFNSIVALTQECAQVLQERISLEGLAENYPGMTTKPQFNVTTALIDPEKKFASLIKFEKYQRGFLELMELFDRTGIKDLHIIKRDTILLLGSERYSKDSRAEAIMSVLGARDWNLSLPPQINPNTDNENLVLGQYPLDFVQYVARALGATFFNSLSACSCHLDFVEIITSAPESSKGCLLPFTQKTFAPNSAVSLAQKFLLNWTFLEELHNPTVQTWKVQTSGSVYISEAAIIASTRDSEDEEIIANVWLTYDAGKYDENDPRFSETDTGMGRYKTVNLKKLVKEYYPFSNNYAVELLTSNGSSRGILLKEVRRNSIELVKIGNYITSGLPLSVRQNRCHAIANQVDWTVV